MKPGKRIELKIRYLDMLQCEGCMNEVLFDKPEWDNMDGHDIMDYDIEKLIALIPDDVIFRQWGCECFTEEGFAA